MSTRHFAPGSMYYAINTSAMRIAITELEVSDSIVSNEYSQMKLVFTSHRNSLQERPSTMIDTDESLDFVHEEK